MLTLIGIAIAIVAILVVLTVLLPILAVFFGLFGMLALGFKIVPLVIVAFVVFKLMQWITGASRRSAAEADREWLDSRA
ncbi:MAG TPA: hypothetical protein VHG91_21290 [Longimicrobium sp.]|nr:hypothetical protein [Longimicrobium sp.]